MMVEKRTRGRADSLTQVRSFSEEWTAAEISFYRPRKEKSTGGGLYEKGG
jgi:hypothetical protein